MLSAKPITAQVPLQVNITVPVNNDLSQPFFLLTYQVPGSGIVAPLNLTGYTLKFVLKASSTATDASGTTYAIGSGITVTNLAISSFTVLIPHTQTLLQTPGTYWYRLDVIDGSLNVNSILNGNVYVLAE